MITIKETERGCERIGGNPVLVSLDGERKAPLRVILHSSWTAKDRAAFGIYLAEPMEIPDGKRAVNRRFEKRGESVVEVAEFEDAPPVEKGTDQLGELRKEVEALAVRVAINADDGVRS